MWVNRGVSLLTKLQHSLSVDELSLGVALIIHKHMFISELTGQPWYLMDTLHT